MDGFHIRVTFDIKLAYMFNVKMRFIMLILCMF